jgi:hypothetical protein
MLPELGQKSSWDEEREGLVMPQVMSAWDFWIWGVALPVTLAGIMVHYLPRWRKNVLAWFQNVEQMRFESHQNLSGHRALF